jgi:hypothetical protein
MRHQQVMDKEYMNMIVNYIFMLGELHRNVVTRCSMTAVHLMKAATSRPRYSWLLHTICFSDIIVGLWWPLAPPLVYGTVAIV